MKKLIAILAISLVTGFSSIGFADLSSSMVANVYVVVAPNVAIAPLGSYISADSIQHGTFSTDVTFRIDANQEAVQLSAAASPLFKGDDPTNNDVAPIPLDEAAGIRIKPTNANPFAGGSNVAQYSTATDIEGFPGLQTNSITFESSQNGHFSQNVTLTVWWNQDDHEKPTGEYSGKVRLSALLLPGAF